MKPLGDLLSRTNRSKVSQALGVGRPQTNSRLIQPGDVFFAIRGHSVDGHQFVQSALAQKAAAVVIEDSAVFDAHPNTILVPCTRQAYANACAAWFDHPSAKLRLVGITGTNGKTTTVHLLRKLWQALGLRAGSIGTIGCFIGDQAREAQLTTPDPYQLQQTLHEMVGLGIQVAAMEVSSIALDQQRVTGCAFDIGAFTNLTQDHLDYHRDMEDYAASKWKLFSEFPLRKAILNIDDPMGERFYQQLASSCRVSVSLDPSKSADFSPGNTSFSTQLSGRHNLYNCMTALAVCAEQGLSLADAIAALSTIPAAPGRLEKVEVPPNQPTVFVDYAHTPDALLNVLSSLRGIVSDGRILTVFGCGGDRDRSKRSLMAKVASQLSEVTIATSDNPRTEDPERILDDIEKGIDRTNTQYLREADRRKAIHLALRMATPRDTVLVAGKGHEDYQILGTRKIPFDDRTVVREYFC